MANNNDPVASRAKWIWVVLLVLLAIALVAWLLNPDLSDDNVTPADALVTTQEELPDPATPDLGPAAANVTGAAMLGQVDAMVGRTIELPGIAVNRVVGDEAFTIGTGAAETLVMFDETRTPDMAREGMLDINPGSRVTVTGTVRSLDGMELPDSVSNDIANGEQVYIAAANVAMMN